MPRKLTTEQFIEKAKKVHGDLYDYSKVEYDGTHNKVCIICPKHGEFWQTPHNHLSRKQGCPKCSGNTIKKNEDFIADAKKIHGDKYDYSKVEYKGSKNRVCIICPKHGEFWQEANAHLHGAGCPKCKIENTKKKLTKTFEDFVKRAKTVHGDKYIYHKETYTFLKNKMLITCPTHGEFWQRAEDHIRGCGCPKCSPLYKTNEKFIEQCKIIHKNFYSYEKTEYINKMSLITITCPIHGDFKQIACNHLKGCKCPKCAFSKLEKKMERILDEKQIEYSFQKKFDWLGLQRLDFFLPKYNIAIECQGIQHFMPKEHLGGENGFKDTTKRDSLKKQLCDKNGIKLLYYTDLKPYDTFLGEKLIKNEKDLIKAIMEK